MNVHWDLGASMSMNCSTPLQTLWALSLQWETSQDTSMRGAKWYSIARHRRRTSRHRKAIIGWIKTWCS
jgi:hypothetical protein